MQSVSPSRVPHRRSVSRRRSGPSYPLKLASVVVTGACVAYAFFVLVGKTLHPYLLGHREGAKIAVMQESLDRQTATNVALHKRIEYLQTPEGAESQARRSGFHRPGEVVYLLPTDSTAPEPK
jgi:hypothetical protein